MKDKIIKKLKEFFSSPKDVISFFLPIVIAIILIIPVPYYITTGGGTLRIDKKIYVDNEYESKGTLNSAYVKEMNGTILTYLIANIVPSYEITKVEDVILENEEKDDYDFREKLYFTNSIDIATRLAYEKANKSIKIKDEKLYVVHVENKNNNINTGDEIVKVNSIDVNTSKDIEDILNSYNNDNIDVKVIRDGKSIDINCKLDFIDGKKKLGIYLMSEFEYETDPKISFSFSNREAGPSGGLMLTLSIYNKLVSEDITRGKKIVGTGTIDEYGNVGEIGGVKYKLMGAVSDKADVFIVPVANYDEAKKVLDDEKYNIKLISVSTFDEALEALRNI